MKITGQGWRDSYIVRFFIFLTNFVYQAVGAGFIGRLFTSYRASNRLFASSLAGRISHAAEAGSGRMHRIIRRRVALAMNESLINRGLSGLLRRLCRYSLRTFGSFLVTAGIYSAVMYWLVAVVWRSSGVEIFHLFSGVAMLVLGIPLLFSDASLGHALAKGWLFNRLVVSMLGVQDDAITEGDAVGRQGYVIAVPLGMVFGALSALTNPVYLPVGVAAFLLFYLVLSVPETGVLLMLLFLPFAGFLPYSEYWLLLVAAVSLISYIGKLLRGNRSFHLEVQDIPILLLMLLFLLSGFSVVGTAAWKSALLSTVFAGMYLLVVNVIATKNWSKRCATALILSAIAASMTGIVQYLLAALQAGQLLSVQGSAVCAGFADQTTFAYFLVIAFPFAVSAFADAHGFERLWTGFAVVSILLAAVLTWVHSAVIAILVMLVVFLLLHRRYSFPFVLIGGAVTPALLYMLPTDWKNGLMAFLGAGSDTTAERTAYSGGLAMQIFFEHGEGLFSGGSGLLRLFFGLGSGGVESFCMLYTSLAPEVVGGSLNFWLYRLLENGVLGVLLPAAFLFLLCQNCFSLLRGQADRSARLHAIAGVMTVTGVLLISLFYHAWQDPAALIVFFVATGLIVANARFVRSREVPMKQEEENGSRADVEYYGGRSRSENGSEGGET